MTYPSFKPIPALADLRDAVLERSTTRTPKWRFRLSPEIVMTMQPKPVPKISSQVLAMGFKQRTVAFECRAVFVEDGAKAADLDKTPTSPRNFVATNFDIRDGSQWHWEIVWRGAKWSKVLGWDGLANLKREVAAAFVAGRFDRITPDIMLRPHCLICGRALTDPASMARWIGPECSGDGSLRVPFILEVDPPQYENGDVE